MTKKVTLRYVGFFWWSTQQFFRFWRTYDGWMWACGPVNVIYGHEP